MKDATYSSGWNQDSRSLHSSSTAQVEKIHAYGNSRNISAEHRRTGKALLAIDPDQPTRIVSTDKKAQKAGGLCLALKGVPVKPTDDVDKEYQLIPIDSL